MSATQITDAVADALVDAAEGGIEFDGLVVERADGGYRWETPDEQVTVTEELLRERAADPYATNWFYWERVVEGHDTPRRAFLRWLEGADDHSVPERYDALQGGHTRSWGELAVTAVLNQGGSRRYEVRHEDDVGEDVDAYHDPLEARHLVKHDDDGRYRPLSTAPTLPHGWAFVDL
ncbi:MAG: DR2241 family protein, partial [Halobacterium sp.]